MTAEALSDSEPQVSPDDHSNTKGADGEIAVWISPEGIIRIKLPEHAAVTGAQAEEASAAARSLAAGHFYPILMDVTGVVSVSREARDVYNRSEAGCAYALLGQSPVDRVMAHYFLGPDSPDRPAAYFTSEADAIGWLEAQIRAS